MSDVAVREKDKIFLSGNFDSIASMQPSAADHYNQDSIESVRDSLDINPILKQRRPFGMRNKKRINL